MGVINKQWHEANRMPARASLDQRIAWHREHQQHCSCRAMPARIAEEIARRNQSTTRAVPQAGA
jgi:hypothetical protein